MANKELYEIFRKRNDYVKGCMKEKGYANEIATIKKVDAKADKVFIDGKWNSHEFQKGTWTDMGGFLFAVLKGIGSVSNPSALSGYDFSKHAKLLMRKWQ